MRGSLLPDIVYFTIVLSSIGIGVFLARKNIRRRNVDVGAAWRVTLIVFACRAAYGLIAGHRSWSLEAEYRAITATLGTALLVAAQVGLAYVALEPYVRRRWPEAMIGWARLVRGRFRDPVVGRDLLVGVTAGLAIRLVDQIRNAAAPIANGRVIPSHLAVDALISLRETVGGLFAYVGRSIFFALFGFFVLVLLRKTVRSRAVAAAFWLVLATLAWIRWDDPVIEVVVVLTQMVILLWALQRFGLLAMTAAIFVHLVTVYTPLTADLHAFYFPQAATAVVALAALIVYASTAATVRQPAAPSSTQ